MSAILQVKRVGFSGRTGDDRSPESFAFPACLTSLLEAMGDESPVRTIYAHDTSYTKRVVNDRILAASGMAFGFLWDPAYCFSAMDLMQVTPHEETIRRAFDWVGRAYTMVDNSGAASAQEACARIVRAIDGGAPVLAFGLFDHPECALVAGYEDEGQTLLGWSHFQDDFGLPTHENGMFRLTGWHGAWWRFVFVGERCESKLTPREVLAHGLAVMRQEEADGYLAGQRAYRALREDIAALREADDAALGRRFGYHHALLFNLAEARCWGANFLREAGAPEAAACFSRIHDLCWEADAVTRAQGAAACRDDDNIRRLCDIVGQIASLDREAMDRIAAVIA